MRIPAFRVALALIGALAISLVLSIATGPLALPGSQSLLALIDHLFDSQLAQLQEYQRAVIVDMRLPRTLLAVLTGALLAQCGAVMQGLFRNPLADPGIIGVSSGAAVGAVLAIVAAPAAWVAWATPVAAFSTGLLTTLAVYALARTANGTSVTILLLAGVALAAFAGSAIGLMSYFASDQDLRSLSLWQMGSLTSASSQGLLLSLAALVLTSIQFQRRAAALNALLLGEAEARHLGIQVERLKLELILLTAVAVGIAVANTGVIGFVGLVVPHIVRMLVGPDHKLLLPLSAVCGALMLLLADTLARVLVPPAEIPVGIITALIGAPFFLFLLIKQRRLGKL
ncbi:FecCD family ABC transporter permease [Marinobacterium mangrovicola]|uniref:Iron complex transport system permease protein n=1 Tax=Marinobacterium mangrovicola TaxID=1476959 RepID=A0A4V2PD71_9GAMM|nr:iron ABC transporter permease [Marinobacterium mangrovicola]TCK04056.1 iron complex transport system permease protein [Marinobacterium mangrovicola]